MSTLIERLALPSRKALTIDTIIDPERQSWEGLGAGSGSWSWPSLAGNETIDNDFETYINLAYRENGIVFSCILARQLLFSEARFQYRRRIQGRPGDLFGDPLLSLLEHPWPGGTTGELLSRMESDASLAGNFYATTVDDLGRMGRASRGGPNRRLARMRPDWVTIVVGVPGDERERPHALAARVLAYLYSPTPWGSPYLGGGPETLELDDAILLPDEVCHFSPIPDPGARWRGMSWLTPVLKEIEADKAATIHKRRFFKGGATPALSVSFDKDISTEAFERFIAQFKDMHGGADNAYKPLFLVGADVKPLTVDLKQLDFKATQGAGETRIAAAARVPPLMAGLSEGLGAASYGNYMPARRHFADGTIRPLWRMAAASLQPLVDLNDGSELWYDDRDIAFLQEDKKDDAEIQGRQATTVRTLLDGGCTFESIIRMIETGDWSVLKHTGMLSVQLQKPGAPAGTVDPALARGAVNQALAAQNGSSGNG